MNDLIFDLGMHRGFDSAFYLAKGFRVVALEANPAMCAAARQEHAAAVAAERMVVLEAALWTAGHATTRFYVNTEKDDWSSALRDWAGKGQHVLQEIEVEAVTLSQMFDRFGVPHYVKCDIEGADDIFLQQLLADARRPAHISVEAGSLDLLALLRAAGYDRFQLINQALLPYVPPPEPAREGDYVAMTFNGHMSGVFGRELDPGRWLDFTEAARRYVGFVDMAVRDPLLAHGWLDFHATTAATLAAVVACKSRRAAPAAKTPPQKAKRVPTSKLRPGVTKPLAGS